MSISHGSGAPWSRGSSNVNPITRRFLKAAASGASAVFALGEFSRHEWGQLTLSVVFVVFWCWNYVDDARRRSK